MFPEAMVTPSTVHVHHADTAAETVGDIEVPGRVKGHRHRTIQQRARGRSAVPDISRGWTGIPVSPWWEDSGDALAGDERQMAGGIELVHGFAAREISVATGIDRRRVSTN
jgi:hypothetical protein